MDKQRSKTSLDQMKTSNFKPQQKYSVIIEVNKKSNQNTSSKIKAEHLNQVESITLEKTNENHVEKQNPEQEMMNNAIYEASLKSEKLLQDKSDLQDKQDCSSFQKQQTLVNFNEFFSQKKKYSSLTRINNTFLSVIESGKICISPSKLSVGYKKDKLITQPSLENLLSQEEQKIKLISSRKQQMLEGLSKLYDEEKEIRKKRKALMLSRKVHHESTNLLRSRIKIEQSPIKKLKKSSRKSVEENQQSQGQFLKMQNQRIEKASQKNSERSYFTQQQKKSVVRILKQRQIKQFQLERKLEEVIQQAEKQKIQNFELQQQKKEVQREKRRSKVLERLEKSKLQRKSYFRGQNLFETPFKTEPSEGLRQNQLFTEVDLDEQKSGSSMPKSLPKRKYIYMQFQKLKAEKQDERKKYEEIMLQKRRQETKINFEQIKVHLRKYKQIKTKQVELQKEKIQSLRIQQKQRLKEIRQKYGFLTKIKQNLLDEERKSIEMFENQLNTKANYQQKMRDYFTSVKQKTLSKSRLIRVSSRVKTSISFQKQEANEKSSLQASKNATFNKNSLVQSKHKNKTHFLSRKKNSFQQNSRTQLSIQKKPSRCLPNMKGIRKDQSKEFERKEAAMMNILKNQDASIEDIQKAFGIFKDLNKSFWQSSTSQKGKLIKSQGHLLSEKAAGQN